MIGLQDSSTSFSSHLLEKLRNLYHQRSIVIHEVEDLHHFSLAVFKELFFAVEVNFRSLIIKCLVFYGFFSFEFYLAS